LLESSAPQDALYAVRQLDEMSNPDGRMMRLSDFDRGNVLEAISRLLSKPDIQLAQAAIQAIGGSNPYFKDESAEFWLAKISGGRLEGLAPWESDRNPGAHKFYQPLMAMADGVGPANLRASAIRALGRAEQPDVGDAVKRWVFSPEPQIREAATILLADFSGPDTNKLLRALAGDSAFQVRKAVTRVIGFSQLADLLPLLDQALHDENREVRHAAAQSLVSFPPNQSAAVLRANMADQEYRSVFVNALAKDDPRSCLDALCDIIANRLHPVPWDGKIAHAASWDILFAFLKTQSRESLQSGQFDKELSTLEKAQIFSSSPPRDLYELYIKNEMKERALRFREYVRRTSNLNLESFFDQVDMKYRIGKHSVGI
jgi:HEAT repeat protein